MALATCKGCQASIRWGKMATGANMPVNPERLSEWIDTDAPKDATPRIRLVVFEGTGAVLTEGVLVEGRAGSQLLPGTRHFEGFVPHWATCPQRGQFKR